MASLKTLPSEILALDLSTACTGYSIFSLSGACCSLDKIEVSKKLHTLDKIKFVVDNVAKLFPKVTDLVIEDTFRGVNAVSDKVLNRLGGAVIYKWMEYSGKKPYLYNASSSRKLAGLNSQLAKAEIQLWVIHNFFPRKIKLVKNVLVDREKIRKDYVKGKLTKRQWNYKLDKISKEIAKLTGVNNDMADSVIVALAHLKKVYNIVVIKE